MEHRELYPTLEYYVLLFPLCHFQFKVTYSSGLIFEKKNEAVPHIFYTNN